MGGPARKPPSTGAIRRALIWTFRRIIGLYFREIEATGAVPSRATGGRVFVGNHMNGLVDPILVLTSAPCEISPIAKSTLWKIPGLPLLLDAAGAVPILRRRDDPTKDASANDEVFATIASALKNGRNILIFPEGTSHNEPQLLALKSGAARMLCRAEDEGATGLTYQAVALVFDDRQSFRSRCLMIYGPVRSVADCDATGDQRVAALTEIMRKDLSELLVEGATWPERLLIARVAEMVANDAGDASLERWNAIGRQVEAARKALAGVDEATVAAVSAAVDRYYALLGQEGLVDAQLAGEGATDAEGTGALALAALFPLAIAGTALYALPYRLPRFVVNVRHVDPDEASTIKLGVGLVVYPIWAAALIGAGFAFLPPLAAAGFAALAVVSPFAALAWLDVTPRLRRSLRFRSKSARLGELRAARSEAMGLIRRTQAKLGLDGDAGPTEA